MGRCPVPVLAISLWHQLCTSVTRMWDQSRGVPGAPADPELMPRASRKTSVKIQDPVEGFPDGSVAYTLSANAVDMG